MVWQAIAGSLLKPLVGGAMDFAGKRLEDKYINDPNSAQAYRRQKDFYQHRYQWMMNDMEKAGLNPILAAGSAGFSAGGTPSVAQSAQPRADVTSSAKNLAAATKMEEETRSEQVRQMKILAEAKTELEKASTERARQGLMTAQEKQAVAQVQELWQRIHKMRDEQGVLKANKKILAKQLTEITYRLEQLRNISQVYAHSAGKYLTVIREILRSLGINVGILPGLGRRR